VTHLEVQHLTTHLDGKRTCTHTSTHHAASSNVQTPSSQEKHSAADTIFNRSWHLPKELPNQYCKSYCRSSAYAA
jgi:hypothetical protein